MLDAARYDSEFACLQMNLAIAKFDEQVTFDDEEEFVFGVVLMPDELAFELGELDVGVVDFADDLRAPIIVEEREFCCEINLFHRDSPDVGQRTPCLDEAGSNNGCRDAIPAPARGR